MTTSLQTLLQTLTPTLLPTTYTFARIPGPLAKTLHSHPSLAEKATMIFYEAHRDATTLILPLSLSSIANPTPANTAHNSHDDKDNELMCEYECRQITITIHSALSAVGFLPVLTGALAARGISCNAVSAFYSDHLFVPAERAEEAVRALEGVREDARAKTESERESGGSGG